MMPNIPNIRSPCRSCGWPAAAAAAALATEEAPVLGEAPTSNFDKSIAEINALLVNTNKHKAEQVGKSVQANQANGRLFIVKYTFDLVGIASLIMGITQRSRPGFLMQSLDQIRFY